jgi:glucose/arabinose dehydrogenase
MGLAFAALIACASAAAKPPKGFELRTLVRGLDEPTAFAWAPGGRIYISQKRGLVKVFDHGKLATFIDLRSDVNDFSERGLVNLALDPAFARNRTMYLFYTGELRKDDPDKLHPGNGTLISLRVSATDPHVPEPGSRRTVLSGFDAHGPWHEAAGLAFDPRGRLLVGFGDGSPYYPKEFSVAALRTYNLDILSGKILRIDPKTGHGVPDNPFYDRAHPEAVRSKVVAYGFRNPFSIQIDPETDQLYVGDVGTDAWEEVDVVPLKVAHGQHLNYGWPCYEGGDRKPLHQSAYAQLSACVKRFYDAEAAGKKSTIPSVYAYPGSGGAAIVVGPLYRSTAYPESYRGRLFVADWSKDRLWTLEDGKPSDFGSPNGFGNPVYMKISPRGTIAYLAYGVYQLNEIVYVGSKGSGGWSMAAWIGVPIAGVVALAAALWLALRPRARLRRLHGRGDAGEPG